MEGKALGGRWSIDSGPSILATRHQPPAIGYCSGVGCWGTAEDSEVPEERLRGKIFAREDAKTQRGLLGGLSERSERARGERLGPARDRAVVFCGSWPESMERPAIGGAQRGWFIYHAGCRVLCLRSRKHEPMVSAQCGAQGIGKKSGHS